MTVGSGNWNGSEKVVLREVYCARIGPYTDNETIKNRNNEARQRNKSYMDQMFADQLAARKIFQDALNTRAHIQRNSDIL